MNTKILEKNVHFFNVDFAEDIPMQGYPKISDVAVRTCTTIKSFLKTQQNSQKRTCTRVPFQPATFNFIGKETSTYIDFCQFCKVFKNTFITENLLQIGFGLEFYGKWRTDILIIIKIHQEVDRSFKNQTLRGKVYI